MSYQMTDLGQKADLKLPCWTDLPPKVHPAATGAAG